MDDSSEIFHMKHIENDWKPWTEMATKTMWQRNEAIFKL